MRGGKYLYKRAVDGKMVWGYWDVPPSVTAVKQSERTRAKTKAYELVPPKKTPGKVFFYDPSNVKPVRMLIPDKDLCENVTRVIDVKKSGRTVLITAELENGAMKKYSFTDVDDIPSDMLSKALQYYKEKIMDTKPRSPFDVTGTIVEEDKSLKDGIASRR